MNERLKELVRQAKPSPNLIWKDAELARFAELVRNDEREAITQGYKDMLSALRAIVAVAETEKHSFSMHNIKDCANIAIKQARSNHEQD